MQALTIIGLGTAYTNIQLMLFAVWPFGQSIRDQVRSRGHSGISVPVPSALAADFSAFPGACHKYLMLQQPSAVFTPPLNHVSSNT